MKLPDTMLVLAACLVISCTTPTAGPCVRYANSYQAMQQAKGNPVYTVYYLIQNADGSVRFSDSQGKFVAHAINYWQYDDAKRRYIDAGYSPVRTVPAPDLALVIYDSQRRGSPAQQEQVFLDEVAADPVGWIRRHENNPK